MDDEQRAARRRYWGAGGALVGTVFRPRYWSALAGEGGGAYLGSGLRSSVVGVKVNLPSSKIQTRHSPVLVHWVSYPVFG